MKTHRTIAAAAAFLALVACDNPAGGGGGDGAVRLRFGVAGSQALASQARFQTGGADQLVLTGSNGTLRIDDLRMVVAEFELDGDDDLNPCGRQPGAVDDCEDFEAGPMFIDLPLTGGAVPVGSGDLPAGVYEEVEFEVEDLDDDEEDPAERARIEQLRGQILAQFPDWPRDASLLVVGTFTPTGGQPVSFRAFVEAEIEIETELSPPLVVGDGEPRSLDVLLDPAAIFRSGANVLNLSQPTGRVELESRIRSGFSGRGGSSDD
jgi:hypothetical protein